MSTATDGPSLSGGSGDRWPFIPAWLDDAGLTPSQFRVFCHIARRVNCFASLAAMSRICHMRRRTIQTALNDLLESSVIIKEKRPGCTSIYMLAPSPKQALGSKIPTHPKIGTTTSPKIGTTHLAQNRHYKGSPSEGSPIKGEEAPPVGESDEGEYRRYKDWQLQKDLSACEKRLSQERECMAPDRALIRSLRERGGKIKTEVKHPRSKLRGIDQNNPSCN